MNLTSPIPVIDPLTGARTRDALAMSFQEMVAQCRRQQGIFSLLFIDIDNVKSTPDGNKRPHGDIVLREIIVRLNRGLSPQDMLIRYQDNEFICLIADANLSAAKALATRLTSSIAGIPISVMEAGATVSSSIRCSFSLGIVSYPTDGIVAESLIKLAHKRTNAAKRSGRNQIFTAADVQPVPDFELARPRLMEREIEAQAIRKFLLGLAAGKSGILHICGARSTGYTRLLEEAEITAKQLGLRTLFLRGSEDRKERKFGVLSAAFGDRQAHQNMKLQSEPVDVMAFANAWQHVSAPGLILCDDLYLFDALTLSWLQTTSLMKATGIIFALPEQQMQAMVWPNGRTPDVSFTLTPLALSRSGFTRFLGALAFAEDDQFVMWAFDQTGGCPGNAARLLKVLMDQALINHSDLVSITLTVSRNYRSVDTVGIRANDVPHNLPHKLNALLGRDGDIDAIDTSLNHHRLVTLIGPGGVGKTRLAIATASHIRHRHRYHDGVWYVELAQVQDMDLLVFTIAKTLGITLDSAKQPLSALANAVREKSMLLILDNLEQIVADAGKLAVALLESAANLTIIATSRTRLQVADEVLYAVPTLSDSRDIRNDVNNDVRDGIRASSDAGQGHFSPSNSSPLQAASVAAQLFIMRAKSASPNFAPVPDEISTIEEICRKIDGLPLAIELAAAKVRVMSLDDIASRLDSRLDLLSNASRTTNFIDDSKPALRTTIQSSVQLLDGQTADIFATLSVMAGSWDITTVNRLFERDLSEAVIALADASLLQEKMRDNRPTFLMLETIREYGQEILRAENRFEETKLRHARFLASIAAIGAEEPVGVRQQHWIARLDWLGTNVREALRWCSQTRNVEANHQALVLLGYGQAWWELRGHWMEVLTWWQRLRPHVEEMPTSASLAACYVAVARSAFMLSRYDECEDLYQRALEIANECGDLHHSATALTGLGNHANFKRQTANAITFYMQALARYRKISLDSRVAYCLNTLGLIARQDTDLPRQLRYYQEAAELREAIGDEFGLAQSHMCLAVAHTDMQDGKAALPYIEKAEVVLRRFNDSRFLSMLLSQAIQTYTMLGEHARALANVREVIAIAHPARDRRRCLFLFATVVAPIEALGNAKLAVSVLSATYKLCRQENIELLSIEQLHMQQDRQRLTNVLCAEDFLNAWREGDSWSLDETISQLSDYTTPYST